MDEMMAKPNQITGGSKGELRRLPMRTRRAVRAAPLWRLATSCKYALLM